MADINSSLDEILTELGDSFDADIASSQRKIVRSTANKIWLILRAFARGLYGIYQVVAALHYRFDPLYCTDEELESTMRITGTTRRPGKVSLLTVIIWNNHATETRDFLAGVYTYVSSNGTAFTLDLQDDVTIPANSFMKRDFFSSLNGEPYIGSFPVSDNTSITVTVADGIVIDEELSFDCEDNEAQLGYPEETLYEVRQRLLTDNQRQEILHILEENLKNLPNIHECTVIGNNSLLPVNSPLLEDDGETFLPILPQSVLIIITGSPTEDFAKEFISLSPFITTVPEGIAGYGTVYYETDTYINGRFPVHYIKHKIAYFDAVVKYGYSALQVSLPTVEEEFIELLRPFQASTKYQPIIQVQDYFVALSAYQNPGVKLLSVTFSYEGTSVPYIRFDKTQLARLRNISFQQVNLWA